MDLPKQSTRQEYVSMCACEHLCMSVGVCDVVDKKIFLSTKRKG